MLAGNGTMAVLARSASGPIVMVAQSSPTSTFTNYGQIGSGMSVFQSSPVAALAYNSTIVVVATGSDGGRWLTNQSTPTSSFIGWVKLV